MRNLKIKQTIISTAELIKSGLAEKWFDNFGMKHILSDKLARMESYGAVYYIVEAEAEHNYGLDFNIFIFYTVDGIKFLKQLCTTSSITNFALRRVMFDNGEIIFSKEGYSKEDRMALKRASDAGWVFS